MDISPHELTARERALRIIFMGTPTFAVASLDALLKAGYQVVAVITAPDKPAGRGLQLSQSPVKQFALQHHLPVLQPVKLRDPAFISLLKTFNADLQVVVAFRMLPEVVWSMPPMGTINVHGSLLPDYRGAAPVNRAVMNGEKETGVTTFKLQQEIDTGNILGYEKISIGEDETAGELHDRMMIAGARLLVRTVSELANGRSREIPQQEAIDPAKPLHAAPKIFKDDCQINWHRPVAEVYNLIRGLSPSPAAWTMFDGKSLKIFRAEKKTEPPSLPPGEYDTDGKSYLRFAASDGWIYVRELQIEGKKKMLLNDFLRGYR